jgi:hypothetical protein
MQNVKQSVYRLQCHLLLPLVPWMTADSSVVRETSATDLFSFVVTREDCESGVRATIRTAIIAAPAEEMP